MDAIFILFKRVEEKTGFNLLNLALVLHICIWYGIVWLISRNESVASILAMVSGLAGVIYVMRRE